jgi:DNA-binding NarL/FixJ family response regulator
MRRNAKFVFLTMYDDANLPAAALEIGRVGFVLKRSGGIELLKAIEEILHGRSYLTPKLRTEDWVAAKARARQFSKELTQRQREIVRLFAEGRPTKEIAWVLHVSEKTVEFHKHNIYGGVQSQEQRRSGLICTEARFDQSRSKPCPRVPAS